MDFFNEPWPRDLVCSRLLWSWEIGYRMRDKKRLVIKDKRYHPIPQGFSSFLLKPYIKAVTHFWEVEWCWTLMVECVTVFWLFDPTSDFVLQMGLQAPLPINNPCIDMIYAPSGPLNLILVIQMVGHFISMIVKSDVGLNSQKRLHIPPSKFSTIQLHKNV